MGPDGDSAYFAFAPDVAYNATHDEYLVTWWGTPGVLLADFEFEIFGQRLDAAGAEVGTDDFRISDMGSDGDSSYSARDPAVAYSALHDEYIVAWSGDDDTGTQVDNEDEIFLQRIEGDRAVGNEAGANDIRVTRMGPAGDTNFFVYDPDPAFGGATDEAFLVWYGSDDEEAMALYEYEVFGRRYQIPTQEACAVQVGQTYTFYQTTTPVTVTVDTVGDIDCLSVLLANENHPNATTPLQTGRYWTITATTSSGAPATGFEVTLTLPHAGADATSRLCRWPGGQGGAGWDRGDGTNTTFTANTVTRSGITGLSDWIRRTRRH